MIQLSLKEVCPLDMVALNQKFILASLPPYVLLIVIHLSWFPIQTYDHVFTDTLLEFDRVFDTSENRSVLENTDLLSLIEKRSVFFNTDLFSFKR